MREERGKGEGRAESSFKEPVWDVGEEAQGSLKEAAKDQPLEGWGLGDARVKWEVNLDPDHGTQILPTTIPVRCDTQSLRAQVSHQQNGEDKVPIHETATWIQ